MRHQELPLPAWPGARPRLSEARLAHGRIAQAAARGRSGEGAVSVRDGVEERRAATLAQHTGDAFQVRANAEQAHDQRRVGNEVTGSDDAAHRLFSSLETDSSKHFSGHGSFNDLSARTWDADCRFETPIFECEDLLHPLKRMRNVSRRLISRVIVGIRLRI